MWKCWAEVPDALEFDLRNKASWWCRFLSGGGARIKIFQAMTMGKTIITTAAIGLEGIEAA